MRTLQTLFGCVVVIFVMSVCVGQATVVDLTVVFDENGNGTFLGSPLSHIIGQDPGPGGLPNALIYTPPFGPQFFGDLLISEPPFEPTHANISDVVRFNENGTIVFYSELPETPAEVPDLADVGLPTVIFGNPIYLLEEGSEGYNWVDYTPAIGQPGYLSNYPGATYHIISDVPEPSTAILFCIGVIGLWAYTWLARK
jgi:hypothetical protein